jgi:hypothetical protein
MIPKGLDDLGAYSVENVHIYLIDNVPVFKRPYRKSEAENQKLEAKLEIMKKANLIEESKSSYSSPIVSVPIKDGSILIVQYYREVNKRIKDVQNQMPTISEIIDSLAGAQFFSSIDLEQGFSQLEKSREIPFFSTPSGYQYTRCPQGIKTGPALFANAMEKTLRRCKKYARNYLDDIIIFSNSLDHFIHVQSVLNALKSVGFKISAKKFKWFASEIEMLGYVASGLTVHIDQKKIEAVRSRQLSKDQRQLSKSNNLLV